MTLPVSLQALREQRTAFLQALGQSPAMLPFAHLLRDLLDDRPRPEKNADLIRAAAGALPLTQPLRDLTSTVWRRMVRAGGWVPDDETIRGVLRKMQDEKKSEPGRESPTRRIAAGTIQVSEISERT